MKGTFSHARPKLEGVALPGPGSVASLFTRHVEVKALIAADPRDLPYELIATNSD